MPIYEYSCGKCDKKFELIQKVDDKPVKKCIECGAPKAQRSMSTSSFRLKGAGFYVNDYK